MSAPVAFHNPRTVFQSKAPLPGQFVRHAVYQAPEHKYLIPAGVDARYDYAAPLTRAVPSNEIRPLLARFPPTFRFRSGTNEELVFRDLDMWTEIAKVEQEVFHL